MDDRQPGVGRLPASKAVLGVPFYSRPTYISYRDLVAQDAANANRDCYNGDCYNGDCFNGLPTIRRKTTWALSNAGGVMNWELSQDTTGSTSLLNAIWETASNSDPEPPPGGAITGFGGKCLDASGTANGAVTQLWDCAHTASSTSTTQHIGTTVPEKRRPGGYDHTMWPPAWKTCWS